MADTQETIADIIAEKRALADRLEHEMAVAKECKEPTAHRTAQAIIDNTRREADRLEAAYKREADYAREAYESALKAERDALREQHEAGALVDGTRDALLAIREAHEKRETPHDILVCRIIDDALGTEGGAK